MTAAVTLPLRFQVGARTLLRIGRRLQRVALSLDDALSGEVPVLPPLGHDSQGYVLTSLPVDLVPGLAAASRGMIAHVRQRYTRYYADLTIGFEAWWAGLSGNTRSGLKRKEKRIGATVTAYRTAPELEDFHAVARRIALTTYQERLMGAGLPDTPEFQARMAALAAADGLRAWTLAVGEVPAAYLYCPVRDGTVLYEYVGHDPAYADLSPGAVLQLHAMRDLFAEGGFTRFDFTEGEGQHKRSMATGGVACVDLLLLRPTLANRAAIAALAGFDRCVALAKDITERAGLQDFARKMRRG